MRSMADVVFHSMADSAYLWTVMHVADEKGISHELVQLDYRSPEHLMLHPFAKMPILQHGDFYLYESLAIATYLDRAFEGRSLTPLSPRNAAETFRWISIVNAYVFPWMNRFTKERLVWPRLRGKTDDEFIASAEEPLRTQMRLVEQAISKGGFLAGDELSMADSFLLPHLLFFVLSPEGEALLNDAPASARWLQRMQDRPSFRDSLMSRAHAAFQEWPKPDAPGWKPA